MEHCAGSAYLSRQCTDDANRIPGACWCTVPSWHPCTGDHAPCYRLNGFIVLCVLTGRIAKMTKAGFKIIQQTRHIFDRDLAPVNIDSRLTGYFGSPKLDSHNAPDLFWHTAPYFSPEAIWKSSHIGMETAVLPEIYDNIPGRLMQTFRLSLPSSVLKSGPVTND